MTLLLRAAEIEQVLDDGLALRAAEHAFGAEVAGTTVLPKRVDTRSGAGFLRAMPAVLGDVMGLKAMTLVDGLGTRYVVLLFAVATGELLAIIEAGELTRSRTAAVTAVAALAMVTVPPKRIGVLGSGFEAEAQLRAVARLWPAAELAVYSPTTERRDRFARSMTASIGRAVSSVGSMDAALEGSGVLVLATKAKTAVVDGTKIQRSAVVLSIGSTRPDLRELDRATFARAGTIVGDDPAQLASESGDVADALTSGAISADRIVSIATARADRSVLRTDAGRDLLVLKTVGTAVQDLALARALYHRARERGVGTEMGDVATLKPFAAPATSAARVGVTPAR